MTSSTPFNVPIVNLNSLKQHEISNNKGKLVVVRLRIDMNHWNCLGTPYNVQWYAG